MIQITLAKRDLGLNKVKLNHLLRQFAGYSLATAKHAVDQVVEGGRHTVELADADAAAARSFCEAAGAIGVICQTTTERHAEV